VSGCAPVATNQEVANTADLIFITTPDDVIASVADQIDWHQGQSVVHCSGADSTEILEPARKAGAQVGCFHPLQTFPNVKQALANIPGSTFALEASEPLLTTLKRLTAALDGHGIELKAKDKVAYHASAVIASNYLVTLVKLATDLWQTLDIPRPQAVQALLPLIKGTIHNIATVGIPECLTGPIVRGDVGTIKKHLHILKKTAPGLVLSYQELGLATIPIALEKGKITNSQAEELKSAFTEEVSPRCRSSRK
jgi:predicted short-subunit dehydrogenase-like oxidoreductase (DUF2520 family)